MNEPPDTTGHRGSPRSPGRPQAGDRETARDTLVLTAASLFARQGYEGTSLRQVAEGARVTPAMVAYYFKDKSGLLEAVVRQGLSVMLGVVRTAAAEQEPGRFLLTLVGGIMAALSRDPWIPQIMIREVVSKESPLRQVFIDEFAVHAVRLIPARVAEEIRGGTFRDDLDPRFTILSLIGMCMFPFIAHPVLGPLLGYRLDDDFGGDYGRHVLQLLQRGVAAGGATPGAES